MRRASSIISSTLLLLLAGCTLVPRPLKPVRYYSILPPAAAAPKAAAGPQERVIAVRLLDAPPRYRERIFFRREGHAAGFHEFDRWADPPAEMATATLRRTLQAAGLAAAVADERLVRRPQLVLEGRLTRFDEVQGRDLWSAECEIEIVLKRDDGGVVLYTLLAASHDARAKTTAAFVEAMNAAVADVAAHAAEAVKKALEDERKAKKD